MTHENEPFLSIVIPVFNRAEVLDATLQSVLQQAGRWECILVDDHSTDQAAAVCQKYVELDPRFRYTLNQRRKGAPGARNTGVALSRGEYIYFFDSDNLLHPHALEKIQSELNNSKADILVFFGRVLNEEGIQISQFHWKCNGNIHHELVTGKTYVDNNLCVIKKACLVAIGLTDENVPSYQEWDTHLRLSKNYRYQTLEEELIDYLKWENGTISSNVERTVAGFIYVIEKHLDDFRKEQEALLSFCMQIDELSKRIDREEARQLIQEKIKNLLPNYASKVKIHRLKNHYRLLIDLVKRKLPFN